MHKVRVGLAGYGNVGQDLASRLTSGAIPGVELVAVSARDLKRAHAAAVALPRPPRIVLLSELPALCDVVVECATRDAFREIARVVLGGGKYLICVSASGLLDVPDLMALLRPPNARVQIATGALPGLEMVRSAAEGRIEAVHLHSTIRPESMAREPFIMEQGLEFEKSPPDRPLRIFAGTAREAVQHFPRHLNIAVALSIAGIGLERTTLELWVDPAVQGAVNTVTVKSDDIELHMTSRNLPSVNRKTSRIVVPSIMAALRRLVAPIVAGS